MSNFTSVPSSRISYTVCSPFEKMEPIILFGVLRLSYHGINKIFGMDAYLSLHSNRRSLKLTDLLWFATWLMDTVLLSVRSDLKTSPISM